jgi:hypothetical protein
MADRTYITATRAPGGIAVTMHASGGNVMRVILSPRRAALLGSDLLSLALEPLFEVGAEKKSGSGWSGAGHPAGVSAPASN